MKDNAVKVYIYPALIYAGIACLRFAPLILVWLWLQIPNPGRAIIFWSSFISLVVAVAIVNPTGRRS